MRVGGRWRLGVGERAADFVLSGRSGVPARFYAHAGGRPTAVVFDGEGDDPRLVDLAGRLAARDDVAVCCVTSKAPEGGTGMPTWSDRDGAVAEAYGVVAGELTAVVLDPNLRVVGVVVGDGLAGRVVELLDSLVYRGPAAQVVAQAPVLLVPRALDATYRDRLIRVWERDGGTDTGVARADGDVLDASVKRRRDHTVDDRDLLRELTAVVGRRVLPEVGKAFAFRATRFEGFKIACYDAATGGFFRPHRDNLTPATAHRVFALTLNLNDDYEGGQLRFPEYGNQLYRPNAGAALVFSCAHLHEVLDVTEGRRFVLLSFLYGGPAG
ncbi:MAG TPA: 2OG-Fe(II) oxygenase [Kineosporiaceae bacterium]|nr:2OG-Fe(II) oxygenase [Kineosporiaceae bacterium]